MAIPPPSFFLIPALFLLAVLGPIAWKQPARGIPGRLVYTLGGLILAIDGIWVLLVAWAYCEDYQIDHPALVIIGRMFGVGSKGYLLTTLAAVACIAAGVALCSRVFLGGRPQRSLESQTARRG